MDFTIDKKENCAVISTTSDKLNTTNAPDLKSELVVLNNSGISNLVIDMESCEYCDSSGLSAILVANRLCEQSGGTFVLTGLQSEVDNLIKISLLDTIITIKEDIDEAINYLESKS